MSYATVQCTPYYKELHSGSYGCQKLKSTSEKLVCCTLYLWLLATFARFASHPFWCCLGSFNSGLNSSIFLIMSNLLISSKSLSSRYCSSWSISRALSYPNWRPVTIYKKRLVTKKLQTGECQEYRWTFVKKLIFAQSTVSGFTIIVMRYS